MAGGGWRHCRIRLGGTPGRGLSGALGCATGRLDEQPLGRKDADIIKEGRVVPHCCRPAIGVGAMGLHGYTGMEFFRACSISGGGFTDCTDIAPGGWN